jgi:predicted CxxxxCH...CXXCH cytochrome family protein
VPAALEDKGHIIGDDLPAEVTWSELASGKLRGASVDLKPSWSRASATCSNVYCHTLDGATVKQWKWTEGVAGGLGCTSCHGQPPAKTVTGGAHPATSAECKVCHASAYDANGKLDPSKHINGKVDR